MSLDRDGLAVVIDSAICGSSPIGGSLAEHLGVVNRRVILHDSLVIRESLSDLILVSRRPHLLLPSIRRTPTIVGVTDGNDLVVGVAAGGQAELVAGAGLSGGEHVRGVVGS